MNYEVFVPDKPQDAQHRAIWEPLGAFNAVTGGASGHREIAVLLRNTEDQQVVGGLWGRVSYAWLFVELLFVPAELRGAGVGARLLARAEAIGRAHSCVGIWLDTYSFQAPGFYLKQGYEVFGTLDGAPNGPGRSFFRKAL